MAISTGSQVARYRILQKIGAGGMGEVYLAEDASLGRKVAIKILPEQFTQQADRVRRFEQEARAASALNHPNIITIYEIGQVSSDTGALHFIATEFIEGETLRQRMNAQRMTLSEALDVAIQAASALQAAHNAGIAHRDIKPENIMLRPDGYVKVLDFGLAKLTEQNLTGDLTDDVDAQTKSLFETQPGLVIGTVAYMSPEQARGQRVDGRTDIFSLGVVLYELLSGRRPFTGATASDMIAALLVSQPARLSQHPSTIPAELESIVSKMLVKDRDERYQSAREVVNDLNRVKARLSLPDLIAETGETALLEQPTAKLPAASLAIESGPTVAMMFATNIGPGIAPGLSSQPSGETSGQRSFDTNIAPVSAAAQQFSAQAPISAVGAMAVVQHPKRRWRRYALPLIILLAVAVIGALLAPVYDRWFGKIDSIAVVPFANVNEDPDAEYLSDGITESLISTLSQLPEVSVSSRNAVIRYKGAETDARSIGHDLDVKAVLLGRLIRRGENLTVSVELVEARNGRLIWSDRFTRKISDMAAIQEEITQKISDKLRWRLTDQQKNTLANVGTQNPEAYDLYLKGRYYWNQNTPDAKKKADEFFEEAAGKDGSFAAAFAGCAACHAAGSDGGAPVQSMVKAKQVALAALKRDATSFDAHLTLATVNFRYDWDFPTAEREFKRAMELAPKSAVAHQRYAEFLALLGRHKEANTEIWKARSLDPHSLPVNQAIGAIQYYAGEYDHALDHLKKTLAIDDGFAPAHTSLGLVYEQTGKPQDAVLELLRAKYLLHEDRAYLDSLKKSYAESNAAGFWRAELAHLNNEAKQRYISPAAIAALQTRLGETDLALASLEKGLSDKDGGMVELKVEPVFESLRRMPRFGELLRRVGLAQ
ncbi:MAG: protein kinase [Blastocatellia bacterium]